VSFDNYRNRVLAKGSTNKDIVLSENKMSFLNYLKNTPNRYNVLIDGIESMVSIQDVQFNYHLGDDKYLLCELDTSINAGSYVIWGNNPWIVKTKEIETIKSHQSTSIGKCNHNLKFINAKDELIERQCIISSKTLYTTGIKDGKVIEIPDGMVGIQIPYDDDTKLFQREQPFIFNETKYQITFYNKIEYEGLIVLICQENLKHSAKDDYINEIADRYDDNGIDRLEEEVEPEIPDVPPTVAYKVTADTEKYDGSYEIFQEEEQIFTIHKIISGVEIDSTFDFTLSDEGIATITNTTNNTCTVYGEDGMQGDLVLTATDVDDTQVIVIDVKILGWF